LDSKKPSGMATALPILSRRLAGRAPSAHRWPRRRRRSTSRRPLACSTRRRRCRRASSHPMPSLSARTLSGRFYRRAKWYHLLMMYGPAFVFGYASMWDRPDGKKEPAPDQ
uniref:Uncharacterized protein n=1 Tax=Aegilops tauschii subsp. strangulata TaxID=200361 RepID=A0A453A3Y8_AEGTS